jgi:hypothetical protein
MNPKKPHKTAWTTKGTIKGHAVLGWIEQTDNENIVKFQSTSVAMDLEILAGGNTATGSNRSWS